LDHETRIRDKVHEEVIPKIAILDSKLFFEILFILGLKKSPFELKQHLIDNVLVPNRNDVVHGRNPSITKDEFDKSFKGVTEMLELFRKEIIIAAKSKSYKKIP
jgi:hypothetical protein